MERRPQEAIEASACTHVIDVASGAVIASQRWAQRDLSPVAISRRGTFVFAAMEPVDAAFWSEDELRPTAGRVSLTVSSWPGRRPEVDGTWQAPSTGKDVSALAVSPGLRRIAWTDGHDVFLARLDRIASPIRRLVTS